MRKVILFQKRKANIWQKKCANSPETTLNNSERARVKAKEAHKKIEKTKKTTEDKDSLLENTAECIETIERHKKYPAKNCDSFSEAALENSERASVRAEDFIISKIFIRIKILTSFVLFKLLPLFLIYFCLQKKNKGCLTFFLVTLLFLLINIFFDKKIEGAKKNAEDRARVKAEETHKKYLAKKCASSCEATLNSERASVKAEEAHKKIDKTKKIANEKDTLQRTYVEECANSSEAALKNSDRARVNSEEAHKKIEDTKKIAEEKDTLLIKDSDEYVKNINMEVGPSRKYRKPLSSSRAQFYKAGINKDAYFAVQRMLSKNQVITDSSR